MNKIIETQLHHRSYRSFHNKEVAEQHLDQIIPVSYTHLTLPTMAVV